jgi:hypothetical protein
MGNRDVDNTCCDREFVHPTPWMASPSNASEPAKRHRHRVVARTRPADEPMAQSLLPTGSDGARGDGVGAGDHPAPRIPGEEAVCSGDRDASVPRPRSAQNPATTIVVKTVGRRFPLVAARAEPRRLLLSRSAWGKRKPRRTRPAPGRCAAVCQGRGGQMVSPAVAEIVGWRRERTASMISLGSIP